MRIIASVAGNTVDRSMATTPAGNESHNATAAAGKAGELTTRTDDNTGVVTSAAHGLAGTETVGLFWTNADGTRGYRIGLSITASDTNTVTLDGGSGDNLPAQGTDVVLSVKQEIAGADFDADEATVILISSDKPALLRFEDGATGQVLYLEEALDTITWKKTTRAPAPITDVITSVDVYAATAESAAVTFGLEMTS